eukprot:TRINITY_DN55004_c0_g1_i1.p1 TRINITY_DN55004_c0_g1~~TRINITY_DN55004_c0_g1_i1.p1  ORF type:complete len:398 (-),score=98.09 TRINITY_DN55004_c0_g1_i1:47-1240(-)
MQPAVARSPWRTLRSTRAPASWIVADWRQAEPRRRRGCASATAAGAARSDDGGGFAAALARNRLLLVAGGHTAGRSSVAAAAALALARSRPTLLVDADDPAHSLGDTLGIEVPAAEFGAASDPCIVPARGCNGSWQGALTDEHGLSLAATWLCGTSTRAFLEELLAAEGWRRCLSEAEGASLAASLGVPVKEMLGIFDCLRPPPGAEMPVALGQLLRSEAAAQRERVVVDAGAAASAGLLQSVPSALSVGLDGVLRAHELLKRAQSAAVPSMVSSGLRLLVGQRDRHRWTAQSVAMLQGLTKLREAMSTLATAEKSVLLVLPYRPGSAGERAALRLIEYLKPSCIALTGYCKSSASEAPRPPWIPAGPAVVTLPWGEDSRPTGMEALSLLADAMLEA